MGQSTHKMFFGCFTIHLEMSLTCLMFQQHLLEELGVAREELRNVCKVMQYSFLFDDWTIWKKVWSYRNKVYFVYLFDSHEHFNLNRVCQDRDNLTEEMKGCQEDSCWLMLGGKFGKNIQTVEKPWKHVEVQPHLSPKTLFDPSLFQEKIIS